MSFVQLNELYPSFDDKIELGRLVQQTIMPALEGDEFPLNELLDITVPLFYVDQDESLYSPQQLRFQRWYESEEGQDTKEQLLGTPPVVRLAFVSVAAIAYSTGTWSLGASSPEIQAYDDSALVGFPTGGGWQI